MIRHLNLLKRDTDSLPVPALSASARCPCHILIALFISTLTYAQTKPTTRPASKPASQPTTKPTTKPADELKTIYATTQPTLSLTHHDTIAAALEPLLLKQARYLITQLHPWAKDPSALLLTSGAPNEQGIRPNGHTAYGLAVLYRTKLAPADFRDKAVAILRFLVTTHPQWKDQWQSALWANDTGKAAWLLWNDLDDHLKRAAASMICEEADRFVDRPPDHQVERDTKAEENAWNSQIISLAYNMFPHHPHHARWGEAAIRWQLSSFVTSADVKRTDVVDGKPLNQWIKFPNIYDDYTLENHDRIHPDYLGTIRLLIMQGNVYDWAGNARPQALTFNCDKIYAVLKKLALPDGGFIYPNGQDWWVHRAPEWIDVHSAMSVLFNDPQAAALARLSLDTAQRMSARANNPALYADHEAVPMGQHIILKLYSDIYVMLRKMGEGPPPTPESELWQQLSGNNLYPFGKLDVLRTPNSISTFSWGRQIMGLVMPLTKDILLTPNDRSLIGDVYYKDSKGDHRDTPIVKTFRRISPIDPATAVPGVPPLPQTCFAIAGVLTRAAGAIEQPFAFLALADGRTIYLDNPHLTATTQPYTPQTSTTQPTRCDFGTLGILNDINWVHHNALRMLFFDKGVISFAARESDQNPIAHLSSTWYNLDHLGIVVLSSSGQQRYIPHPTKAFGRLEQLFQLSHVTFIPEDLKPTALVFYPNQDWSHTRDAAAVCTLVQPDATHFVITLEDNKAVTIDFDRNVITMTP